MNPIVALQFDLRVGGPLDGERVATDPECDCTQFVGDGTLYDRSYVEVDGVTLAFFKARQLSLPAAVTRLMQHYRPPKPKAN